MTKKNAYTHYISFIMVFKPSSSSYTLLRTIYIYRYIFDKHIYDPFAAYTFKMFIYKYVRDKKHEKYFDMNEMFYNFK